MLAATVISFALSFLPVRSPALWEDAYLDALLRMRDPIPVSRELLLIQGTPTVQPVEFIWTLAELRAERVLLPTAWESEATTVAGVSGTIPNVSPRLNQEFAQIDENIAALFEAIRIGSIEPSEADRFVEELRRLVANSNTRIQDRLRRNAGAARVSVEDLVESFGSDRVARDLSDLGVILPRYPSAVAMPVPRRGEVDSPEFRHLSYASLSRYISLANRLGMRLVALEEEGYFDETNPRDRPSIMQDHLRSLRRELYEQPTERRAETWRDAVDEYFDSLSDLIDADTEARLIDRLGTLEETEDLAEESAANLREMQQELSNTFASVRKEYAAVTALRTELAEAVGGSFVILQDDSTGDSFPEIDDRVVVANSVLVGEHLYAPVGWERILLLTAAGLLVGMVLAPFRLVMVLVLVPGAVLLGAALFPLLFLVADIWVDPLSVAAVLVGAGGASLIAAGIAHGRVERTLTGRGATRLPKRLLRRAALRGGLPKNRTGRRRAAVVVVAPDVQEAQNAGRTIELKSFHQAISRKIGHLGGMVLGEEGSIVYAVFDSARRGNRPGLAQHVCAATTELASTTLPGGTPLRCGVEVGELDFYLSPIGGYRATGSAITYARRFCELTQKHRRRALFGEAFVTACREEGEAYRFEEKGKLVVSSADKRYAFYHLTEIDPPSP